MDIDQIPSGASDEDRTAARGQLPAQIDSACARILTRLTRFSMEYELREKQATAYRSTGYVGAVPRQVSAFGDRAGIGSRQATDIVLAQASIYRAALDDLSDLRMRKFELAALPPEAAQTVFTQIMQAIDALDRAIS